MKKGLALWIVFGLMAVSASVFAADNLGMRKGGYGLAGCGLGSMVFEQNEKVQQVLAATTNGTFGTQTFGISSGTSNCSHSGVVTKEKEAEVFVATNFESLHQEMAQGTGENLNALAYLMGCPADDFSKAVKSNYATLGATTDALELLHGIQNTVGNSCR